MESLANNYGYDENIFVTEVPEYLHCVLCSLVLRNPVQILACGHEMCEVCFQHFKTFSVTTNKEVRCPIDRDLVDVNDVREDKHLKRVIGNMSVRCCEHNRGCTWSGDLSELDTHVEQCPFKPVQPAQSIGSDMVKELSDRVEQCESSLIKKDKAIALLQHQIQEQKELKEEMHSLKEQQQDFANVQQENERKISELVEKNMELQGTLQLQEEKHEKLQEEHEHLTQEHDKLKQQHQQEMDDLKGILEGLQLNSAKEKPVVIPQKRMVVEHHCGAIGTAMIDNDNHKVVFVGSLATVSARNAVVPPGAKVWYEVEYTQCGRGGHNVVGWTTTDLPTSVTGVRGTYVGVGSETHSYGYGPFHAGKYRGRSVLPWGTQLSGGRGVVGVALDLVKGEILFSVEGQWTKPMGTAFTGVGTEKKFFPAITGYKSTLIFNFGEADFKYGPPDTTYKAVIDDIHIVM